MLLDIFLYYDSNVKKPVVSWRLIAIWNQEKPQWAFALWYPSDFPSFTQLWFCNLHQSLEKYWFTGSCGSLLCWHISSHSLKYHSGSYYHQSHQPVRKISLFWKAAKLPGVNSSFPTFLFSSESWGFIIVANTASCFPWTDRPILFIYKKCLQKTQVWAATFCFLVFQRENECYKTVNVSPQNSKDCTREGEMRGHAWGWKSN